MLWPYERRPLAYGPFPARRGRREVDEERRLKAFADEACLPGRSYKKERDRSTDGDYRCTANQGESDHSGDDTARVLQVARVAGHADPSITLRVYGHLMADGLAEAARRFDPLRASAAEVT
ncbi:MAG: hypothetical protein MSC30_09700 [Gaiellaceae bacterium MAG52_C11]|nr:hypothetical protein [Candidatus Gaiellasilicea maunaloa]